LNAKRHCLHLLHRTARRGRFPIWLALSLHSGGYCIALERLSYGRYARRDRMIRTPLFVGAGLALAVPAALGANTAAEYDGSPYTLNRIDDGYLRLAGRTGQVSICARHPVGWTCQAVPDERAALEAEIARLQGENIAIKKELLARNLPLPGTVKPEPPAAK